MSSKEQEVGTTKQDDDKPETKTSQEMETTVVSKDTPDSIQKDCGDTKVKLDDLTTKPIGSNKTSDDDDDDEMQLRWDDDDEELNNETPNVKETVSQTEDDVVLRDTGMLENPSTSLVSAVKELESALIESNKEEFDPLTSNKFENSDGAAKNDQETENTGANSSKEILDNIDEIIGKDDTSEIKDDQEHSKTSSDSSIQPNKTDDPKAIGDLEVSKMNVGISFNLTENNKQSELQRSTDFNNLDDTTDSIDKSNVLSSTVNDSLIESDFKFEHGLKKPDMMLEIPTQEIIECLDDFEDSDCEKSDDKNEGIDISTQINSLEGDIDSKIMDDEIQLVDQQINENISDVMTKVQDGKDPDLDVTEVSKNEDLSQKDVEMGDVSEKSDIVPLTNESIKLADKQIVMENPEAIEESNSTGTFSKAVDISTTNDENKKLSEEDSLMEMDESNIMLKNDVTNNDDIEPSKFTEIPAEKINETVSVQATEQDIFATQGKTGDSPVEPKQTIHVEENKNKSKTCDDIQETDLQVSHKKFEEDPKLSESKDNDVTLASDDKSDNVSPKDPEPSENKLADLKSLQSEEPLSKSTLDRKPDTEVTESFETEKREIVEPVLDQEVDTEPPKDAKPSDNAEPMSTSETLDTVTSKAILDQKSDTEQPSEEMKAIESIADQPSTSKDLNNASDQVPDTTDEVPEVEDSLGLLAESSRVMEDDEEGEEEEEGDADDDEDFDQDDESSNQMTAEHSEDSSAQPDKEDGQPDQETPTAEEKQFNFAVASIAGDVAGVDTDETIEDTKVSDDITAPVEVDIEPATTPAEVDVEKEEIQIDKETVEAEPHTEIETVNLSDTSDKETEAATNSILKELLMNQDVSQDKKLPDTVVELEGSSSEDDVQEVNKTQEKEVLTDVKKEETKLTPQKDVKTKGEKKETGSKDDEKVKTESKPDSSMEVFNLDSDEDVPVIASEITIVDKPESNKCINPCCPSGASAAYVAADVAARAYFDVGKRGRDRVCVACARAVADRSKGLVAGIKELTPLLDLDLRKVSSETVEISDSDSDDGEGDAKPEVLGGAVKFLEDNLADVINETWIKYKLDERLTDAQAELNKELQQLEADSKEIDTMLNECQVATDLLRNQLYATFEPERRELTAIGIVDTPTEKYSFCETASGTTDKNLKRRISSTSEQPAKRPAIPLGYTPLGDETKTANIDASNDDDKDVSVVKLSVEAAPSDLPPPGEITRPRLGTGMSLFAMRNSFCTWVPGRIVEVLPKNPANTFTMCRVRFEIRQKIATRVLSARCLAYLEPADVRLTIGTRVIALSKENVKSAEPGVNKKSFYSGIVAEIPNPVNSYRYLIFFDHGYAQYVHHRDTRVVCESSNLVWEEVHPNSREFVKQYLIAYPERPMVRLHAGQKLKTEWNGKWWVTKVLQVDASLVEVSFEDNRTEWIYRGSTRLAPLFLELQAAERQRARPLPRSNQRRMNMPYVEYTRSEEQNKADSLAVELTRQQQQQNEELRRQRAVAKKSTALPITSFNQTAPNLDSVTSRVVYYTPKNAVKPYKMTPHTCSPKCKRTDVLALKDLRTYNPLAKPLLSGWERQIVRFKGQKEVMYRAPCGRRVRSLRELHRYLRLALPDVPVDLFDFGAATHCLAEFVLNKCLVGKKDLSHGKENVPVPCVNYYDESLPEFCSYNTERTPTAGVPLNLDPEFLCGCDCTDDCQDKSKCACWKMTLEGARTIGLDCNVGYQYKRLPEPLPSGIYECNSRCKCKHTCLNRVAQHPLQLKLQVFKTLNRGWGIRALNDVPKGAFLCVYAGNLLTDATANLDGLNEGDEYLAELDYIEVVEQMKEGYEEDIPEVDKKLDRKASDSSSENESSEEEESNTKGDKEDDDFQPGFIGLGVSEFSKRLRKRDRSKKKSEEKEKEKGKEIDKGMEDDGCITISDDEEAKEPTRFMAQSGIGANEFVSKYKSVRTLYGKDEACYIMDAKVQGNIGRYLNHSCTPNVFVQNVFVDTHDPRFPWVAFFALSHIRAGTELTWNYNYDVGSVPDKVLYCYCGAPNCRGRLL